MHLEKIELNDFIIKGRLPYENRKFFSQHLAPYVFLKQLLKSKQKYILEIGIGEGFGLYYLSEIAEKIFGLDMDLKCYDFLKEYKNKIKKDNIEFINADAVYLPFKDNTFSAVITCQVIEHILPLHLVDFLKEIKRVVIPKGIILISTLNLTHNVKDPLKYEKYAPHHKEFDYYELEKLLKEVFDNFIILGLNLTLKHRFFQRLKKWGLENTKPVKNFYNRINTSDFVVSKVDYKKSLDLFVVCYK